MYSDTVYTQISLYISSHFTGTNLTLGSVGVSTSLAFIRPISFRMSSTYLPWEITTPSLDQATSMPKKYESFPTSLVWN